mmetsp:Transcript_19357/g.77086  ORF Transcript_19357/g.77086 Transcript_19357/m.77086 type:complete len:142 (-) Transcript_19357:155-580(-)
MTIGVLVAYRERGVGRRLLDYLLANARDKHPEIAFTYLHVQTSNDAAVAFYRNAGFERLGKIDNYYKRIDPPDCYVLAKLVHAAPADALSIADSPVRAEVARAVGVTVPLGPFGSSTTGDASDSPPAPPPPPPAHSGEASS